MGTGLTDTSPEAERVLVDIARNMSPRRKLEIAESMTGTLRQATLAGIRCRHPGASPDEVRKRLAALLLPPGAVRAIFGWDVRRKGY